LIFIIPPFAKLEIYFNKAIQQVNGKSVVLPKSPFVTEIMHEEHMELSLHQ
jgi:hypothetical protein